MQFVQLAPCTNQTSLQYFLCPRHEPCIEMAFLNSGVIFGSQFPTLNLHENLGTLVHDLDSRLPLLTWIPDSHSLLGFPTPVPNVDSWLPLATSTPNSRSQLQFSTPNLDFQLMTLAPIPHSRCITLTPDFYSRHTILPLWVQWQAPKLTPP